MVAVTAGVRVAVTAHVKTVAVKIAKDVMVPVKAVVMEAVAHGVVAVAGVAPGGTAEIVQHQARRKDRVKDRASASALMLKANRLRWTRLPHLA